jgi:hypothetical protein
MGPFVFGLPWFSLTDCVVMTRTVLAIKVPHHCATPNLCIIIPSVPFVHAQIVSVAN